MNHIDLQKPATKNDVEEAVAQLGAAIMKILENVTTKDDLKRFATKKDLNNLEGRLNERIGILEDNVEDVKIDVKIIKRKLSALETDVVRKTEFRAFQKAIS